MKAVVIKTGEMVDVYHEPQHGQITNIYKECVLVNGRMWTEDELDFCMKANDAPEKIYVHIKDKPREITFSEVIEKECSNIEYIRTDSVIEWIKNKVDKYIVDTPMCCYFDYKRAIEDFKNYIKEKRRTTITRKEEIINYANSFKGN